MAWPQDAYVGQEVVCIVNDTNLPQKDVGCGHIAKHGGTYTIAALKSWSATVAIAVQLKEDGCWYNSRGFRPVQPTKSKRTTDKGMSILHDLLNAKPVRKPEREGA